MDFACLQTLYDLNVQQLIPHFSQFHLQIYIFFSTNYKPILLFVVGLFPRIDFAAHPCCSAMAKVDLPTCTPSTIFFNHTRLHLRCPGHTSDYLKIPTSTHNYLLLNRPTPSFFELQITLCPCIPTHIGTVSLLQEP